MNFLTRSKKRACSAPAAGPRTGATGSGRAGTRLGDTAGGSAGAAFGWLCLLRCPSKSVHLLLILAASTDRVVKRVNVEPPRYPWSWDSWSTETERQDAADRKPSERDGWGSWRRTLPVDVVGAAAGRPLGPTEAGSGVEAVAGVDVLPAGAAGPAPGARRFLLSLLALGGGAKFPTGGILASVR